MYYSFPCIFLPVHKRKVEGGLEQQTLTQVPLLHLSTELENCFFLLKADRPLPQLFFSLSWHHLLSLGGPSL